MSKLLIERTGHDIRVNYEGDEPGEIIKMIIQASQNDNQLKTMFMVACQVILDLDEQQDSIKHQN